MSYTTTAANAPTDQSGVIVNSAMANALSMMLALGLVQQMPNADQIPDEYTLT